MPKGERDAVWTELQHLISAVDSHTGGEPSSEPAHTKRRPYEFYDSGDNNTSEQQSQAVASLGDAGGGRTAPGDTLQGVTPEGKKFCGQIYKEQWRNEVGQVKKLTPHPGEGDTRMKAIKSDSDSDSDEQKRSPGFFRKK